MEWHINEPSFQVTLQNSFIYARKPSLNGKLLKSLISINSLMFLHSVESTGISWKIQLPGDLGSWTVIPVKALIRC